MTRQHPSGTGPVAFGTSLSGDTRPGRTGTVEGRAVGTNEGGATGRKETGLHCRLGRSDLTAVPEVRRALRDLLRHWGRPGCADVAELLTSELVTNALIHTESDAEVTATLHRTVLRVEVSDCQDRLPEPLLADCDERTHGRGLLLVQALADAWGVRMQGRDPGKVVWFELDGGRTGT
ncbi:ATP-binding protein [Streptomyces sp. NPDC004111]|uniref:ATP-binding protein n=1 Tax=Streptomyces sp. NPDC004111 TaxID=3364690 RepID=UPI003674DCE9